MKSLVWCSVLCLLIVGIVAPPVDERKKKEHNKVEEDDKIYDVEYQRYLQEVVNVLESDDKFKEKLMKANPDDIKSGKISEDLEFVNHNVRSKLDELKRQELERLRQAAIKNYELANGMDKKHMKPLPAHVDHSNPHTFEVEDLKKLIVQTTKELEEADLKRKEEFKTYEMEKQLEYDTQLKLMDEKNRTKAEEFHKEQVQKHNKHEQMHHPGSKHQLEEVWEEQDHMADQDFNPKTFFHLHDLDGNGVWDANEVKALFKKELDKVYDPNAPEDDVRERFEEMERMREHVFNESDTNKDQLISYQEFLDQTKRQEFQRDEGWDPIDHEQGHNNVYSDQEYKQYAQQHEEEIKRMIEQGLIPGAPEGFEPFLTPHQVPPQGYHDPQLQHHMAQQQAYQQQGYHDPHQQQQYQQYQQHPQQGYQQHPQQGYQQVPQQQQYQQHQQIPQQGFNNQQQQIQGQGYQPPQGQHQQIQQQGYQQQQHQQPPVQQQPGYHAPPTGVHPPANQQFQPQQGQPPQYQHQQQQQFHAQQPQDPNQHLNNQQHPQGGNQPPQQQQPPPPPVANSPQAPQTAHH